MTRTLTATESRVHFGELLEGLGVDSQPMLVERGGTTVAVVLSPTALEDLQGSSIPDDWIERANRSSEMVARWLGGRSLPDIDEMINFGHDVD